MIVAISREGNVDIVIDQCLIDFTNGTIHDVMHVLKSPKNKRQIEGSLKKFLTYQATSNLVFCLDWQLKDVKIEVKDGIHGKFIEFSRGKIRINMSPNVWRRFRQAVPELRKEGMEVTLTEKKSVSVTRFKNSLFTTLTTQTTIQPYHINLGDGHWGALLQVLPKIDAMIAPGPIIDCSDCNNALQVVSLCQGKAKKTLLSDEELSIVTQNNMSVENQLGIMCDYCGNHVFFDCHCHKVNCMTCSPDCFCKTCGRCTYYYYE